MMNHDAIFKQLLTTFFVEFLELFAPELAALLDRAALVFLDKESFVDLVDPDRREADLIVRARMAGGDAYLIVHLEHQAQDDATIDRRMLRYFSRLFDRYDLPIYPIVLCSYATPRTPVKDHFAVAVAGLRVLDFRYKTVQLNRLDWRAYVRQQNPLAAALMARMRMVPRDRVRVKLACLRLLAGQPLDGERRQMLGAFVSIYLPLTPREERQLQQELAVIAPEERRPIVELLTEWEIKGRQEGLQEGRQEGLQEGRQEGQRALVVRQLLRKFGAMPEATIARITLLAPEQLIALGEALLDLATQADLDAWLEAQARS